MLIDIDLSNNLISLNRDRKSIVLETIKNFFLLSKEEIPDELMIVIGDYVNMVIGSLYSTEYLVDLENVFRILISSFIDSEFLEVFDVKLEYIDRKLIMNILYRETEEKALEINLTQLTLEDAKFKRKYIEDTYENVELLGDPLISFIEMVHMVKPGYTLDKRIDGFYYFGDFRLINLTDSHTYEINAIKNITNGI